MEGSGRPGWSIHADKRQPFALTLKEHVDRFGGKAGRRIHVDDLLEQLSSLERTTGQPALFAVGKACHNDAQGDGRGEDADEPQAALAPRAAL